MEEATGRLGWSPREFWRSTIAEYMALVKGWNRAQSGGVEPMTRERFGELMQEHGETSPSIRSQRKG